MVERGIQNVLQIPKVHRTQSEVCNNSCTKADLPLALARWRKMEIFCWWTVDRAQKVRCCKGSFLLFIKVQKGKKSAEMLLSHSAWQVPTRQVVFSIMVGTCCLVSMQQLIFVSAHSVAVASGTPTHVWIQRGSRYAGIPVRPDIQSF